MHVRKWGDGLVVELPVSVVERLGLKEGDTVAIEAVDADTLRVQREDRVIADLPSLEDEQGRRKAALARLGNLNWSAPPGFRFNREEANER
jgi:antitoxin MazE